MSDILNAIELIEQFIESTKNFNQYIADFKTQSAVERQLAIIGEAVNSLKNYLLVLPLKIQRKLLVFEID